MIWFPIRVIENAVVLGIRQLEDYEKKTSKQFVFVRVIF